MGFAKLGFVIATGVLLLIAKIISWIREEHQHAENAKALGCLPAPEMKTRLPLGLDHLWGLISWDMKNMLPPYVHHCYTQLGAPTYIQNILGVKSYVTNDPKNIQAVLATQFQDFELGHVRRGQFVPLLGDGIFTNDGKAWEHSRALLRPQFARAQVADLHSFEFHAQHYFMHMPTGTDGWTETINLQPMLSRLVLDVATEFLCGDSTFAQVLALPDTPQNAAAKSQHQLGGKEWLQFAKAFDDATITLGVRLRLFERYWLYSPPAFWSQCKTVHKFMDYYVNKALKETTPEALKNAPADSKYVFLNELAKECRDPIELRGQILNVLLAGRDTTAGTMCWMMLSLARNPRVFEKLRASILNDFGTLSDPKPITFEAMKSCTYLQYVINETLRMYPNVSMNARHATKNTTLPRGGGPDGQSPVYVREGESVNYYVFSMHRRKDIWGEDAEEFVPERWQNTKRSWEFLPFNGGPRVCLGQQFALTEAAYMTIRTLQKFDKLEFMDKDPVVRHTYTVTTTPTTVMVRLHEANQ